MTADRQPEILGMHGERHGQGAERAGQHRHLARPPQRAPRLSRRDERQPPSTEPISAIT